jgi:hypothetical protein
LPLFPPWLRAEMVPPVAGRVNPLLVPFPRHIIHDIVVRLPHAWPRHDADEKYTVGPYYIAYLEQVHDNTASIHFDFQTVRRRLEPAELASYREALEHADRVLAVSIGEPAVLTPAWSANVVWLLSALWTIIVLSAIALVQHYGPYLKRPRVTRDPRLARRRGWLWLIAIGVTFSPYNQLKSLITMATLFDEPTWSQLTSRGSLVYRAWLAPLATLQFLACITALLWGCYCVYLFWANRRSFPLAFIVALSLTSAVTIVDHLLSAGLRSDEAPSRDVETFLVILNSVMAAIWIGYCLLSRRVASLFVPIDEGDHEGEPSEPLSPRLAADPEGP